MARSPVWVSHRIWQRSQWKSLRATRWISFCRAWGPTAAGAARRPAIFLKPGEVRSSRATIPKNSGRNVSETIFLRGNATITRDGVKVPRRWDPFGDAFLKKGACHTSWGTRLAVASVAGNRIAIATPPTSDPPHFGYLAPTRSGG